MQRAAWILASALYWAAIASEREQDFDGALERYRRLLAQYPASTRAADANAALARLERE